MRHLLLAVAMLVPPTAGVAQVVQGSIDPGMSRTQVIERLGAPASERAMNGFTYLLYENGCERTCGMSDLVTLQGDSVVDAIFRAAERRYTGESSSPTQGYHAQSRAALAVSREVPDSPARQRGSARGSAAGFALPAAWLGGAATPPTDPIPPVTVDSIVLDISAIPPRSAAPKPAAGNSILPAEWLSDTPPAASGAPAPAPVPPAAASRKSLLPAEWLGETPPAAAQPAVNADAPLPAAPAPKKQSLLPAAWLGETSGAAAPPAKPAPPARPDTTAKKPLLPAEWLTPPPPPAGTAPPPGA
jgi:hypothetical protein